MYERRCLRFLGRTCLRSSRAAEVHAVLKALLENERLSHAHVVGTIRVQRQECF